jgi:hypothetical protein
MNTSSLLTAIREAAQHASGTDFADALVHAYDVALQVGRGDIEEALEQIDPNDRTAAEQLGVIAQALAIEQDTNPTTEENPS